MGTVGGACGSSCAVIALDVVNAYSKLSRAATFRVLRRRVPSFTLLLVQTCASLRLRPPQVFLH